MHATLTDGTRTHVSTRVWESRSEMTSELAATWVDLGNCGASEEGAFAHWAILSEETGRDGLSWFIYGAKCVRGGVGPEIWRIGDVLFVGWDSSICIVNLLTREVSGLVDLCYCFRSFVDLGFRDRVLVAHECGAVLLDSMGRVLGTLATDIVHSLTVIESRMVVTTEQGTQTLMVYRDGMKVGD